MPEPTQSDGLKRRVADTLKWNVVDRVLSQVLYAVTGIVLARVLSASDFGLVGVVLIFQAFGSLFVDSGFASALIQRKTLTDDDYSTVFWFNMIMAGGVYLLLWIAAPWIAQLFGDARLTALSRVMFLSFPLNALSIVQVNRLTKQMNMRPVAIANTVGLVAASVVGIGLALAGGGAWAIVWQTLTLAAVKAAALWMTQGWVPRMICSVAILRGFFAVGAGVMATSFLNTVFQYVYNFFIGLRAGLVPLAYFTQADKWSKMGVMSLSQVLTSSFLPLLSGVQDDPARFRRMIAKTHRFTCYLTLPAMGLLIVIALPVFHTLFGEKWDASVPMFQILLLRGAFTVPSLLYSNYLLSLGRSRLIVVAEAVRDVAALAAIVAMLPLLGGTADHDLRGIEWLLWGQAGATMLSWAITLVMAARCVGRSVGAFLMDALPYLVLTIAAGAAAYAAMAMLAWPPVALCVVGTLVFAVIYLGANACARSRIQADLFAYLRRRL